MKVTCKMSNIAMNMMLHLLNEAFKKTILPKNHYETKKYTRSLSLGYQPINACENYCSLFWKKNEDMQIYPICKSSRWVEKMTSEGKIVSKKVICYFSVTSRLR